MTALNERVPQTRNISNLDEIRALACERARTIIPDLAVTAGFRIARGRRNQLHCVHGEDRNPSAHVYEWGVKCFSCGQHWSPIDLVMLRDGCGFVDALRALAEETFVPWPETTADERAKYRAARAAAPDLACQMEDWARGLYLWAEQRKRDLVACLHWSWEIDNEPLAEHFGREISRLAPALSIRDVRPQLIAESYANLLRTAPERLKRFVEAGRADRENCESTVNHILNMLVLVQPGPAGAIN